MKSILLILCVSLSLTAFSQDFARLAPTPPMGWNSWNYFGKKDINETIVRKVIDAMVDNGLLDAGYNFVVVDGGWRDTSLNANGTLRAHPQKFPHGIKPLADYAHSKGLKFGLHTVPGTHDCGGDKVGAYGMEEIHIQQFIDWGIDFIKVDRCRLDLECDGSCWTEEETEKIYRKWRRILDEKKSNILFSISAYKFREWNPEICNMSRTTGDIAAKVSGGAFFTEDERGDAPKYALSVMKIAEINNQSANDAKPGYWNDPDMMVTGENGLTAAEQYSHFALWCIMSSPLFLGDDPRNMSETEKNIVLNKTAIAINQDPTEQGKRISANDGIEIWKKNLKGGKSAILLINTTTKDGKKAELNLSGLGIQKKQKATDVFHSTNIKLGKNPQFSLEPHGCMFLLVE